MDHYQKEMQKNMQRALELAKKGLGKVSPNPMVGALLVREGSIVAEGYHQVFGGAHAEVEVINDFLQRHEESLLKEAILVCTLEPCCHTNKKTPPCTQLIIAKGIPKVVIACLDPNPEVAGKGVKELEDSGIEVEVGVLKEEAEKLNEVFFHYIKTKLPFVHLKWAQTLDGKIAPANGSSKWISNEEARKEVHYMRLKYDSVLIGGHTLNVDNPELSIRMGYENRGNNPTKVILSGLERLDLTSRIINNSSQEKVIIITSLDSQNPLLTTQSQYQDIEIIRLPIQDDSFSIKDILVELGKRGISSILVEGGQKVLTSFLNVGQFQRYTIYLSQKLLGNGKNTFVDNSRKNVDNSIEFCGKIRNIGHQIVLEGKREDVHGID